MKRKAKIFLSYAHLDRREIRELYDKLQAAGLNPWMDTMNIFAGEKWEQSILDAIRRSDFFLACLTRKSANKRGFLQKEIRTAYDIRQMLVDDDIYLIPVRVENCSVPDPLNGYQWIDLFEPEGWEKLLNSLNREIRRRLKNVIPATIPQTSRSSSATRKVKYQSNKMPHRASPKTRQGSVSTNSKHADQIFSRKARAITEAALPIGWVTELDLFRRAIMRTRIINDARKDLFVPRDREVRDIRIATVSTTLDASQLAERIVGDYRVWLVNDKYRKKLREEFLKYLGQAGEAGAQLVCVNELAYPTPLDKGDQRFRSEIRKLILKYNLSLIAGSYHDASRFYNLSPVIAPGIGDNQPRAVAHAKMTGAIRAFELIRVPPNGHLRYYESKYGTFAILIGIDIYNPSLVFRLMMKNHLYSTEEKIDFVFVPSFVHTGAVEMAKACQDLSYITAALVFYVNCSAEEPRHKAYLAGEELMKGNPALKCDVQSISENVVLYAISSDEYQRIRSKVTDSYSPVTDYLIGQKDGIRVEVTA